MKYQPIKRCPFCGHKPRQVYCFIQCLNPKCRLSYGAGHGNRSDGTRQPVGFTIMQWQKRSNQ